MRWILASTLFVIACGGGGDDALSPDAAPQAPEVTITSHHDQDVVTGVRAITLAGTIAAEAAITDLAVTLDGAPVDASFDDTSFSAELTLGDNVQAVTVTATDAGGRTGSAAITLDYPFAALTTFQPASLVLGQPDFTSSGTGALDRPTLSPFGDPLIVGDTLYLGDTYNHRVVAWSPVPTTSGAVPDLVLGQVDLLGTSTGSAADQMNRPETARIAGGRLFVADSLNNRVLVWNSVPTTNNTPADLVLGQAGFGTAGSGCSAAELSYPESLYVVGDRLLVSDYNNSRILIWDSIPTTSGTPADHVIGQSDLVHCTGNDDDQDDVNDGVPTARTLNNAEDLWTDGTRLIVADSGNNRILIWNAIPAGDFAPADVVLGQPDFVTADPGLGDHRFNFPYFIASNGNQLAVADDGNARVLVWNTIPTADVAADLVLGQGDFDHSTGNDDDQDGVTDPTPTARTLFDPTGVAFVGDSLWVVEENVNHRVLRY